MTLHGLFIIIGSVALALSIIKAIEWLCHRKVRSIEQEHHAPEAEADRRTHIFL